MFNLNTTSLVALVLTTKTFLQGKYIYLNIASITQLIKIISGKKETEFTHEIVPLLNELLIALN